MKQNKYNIPQPNVVESKVGILSGELVNHQAPKDERTYSVSFFNYKKKDCELQDIEGSSAKKIIKWMREIGLSCSWDEAEFSSNIKSVRNENHYSYLFSGLPLDIEIKEIVLSGENRLFFYIDAALKVVNCILIKNCHLEAKKKKR